MIRAHWSKVFVKVKMRRFRHVTLEPKVAIGHSRRACATSTDVITDILLAFGSIVLSASGLPFGLQDAIRSGTVDGLYVCTPLYRPIGGAISPLSRPFRRFGTRHFFTAAHVHVAALAFHPLRLASLDSPIKAW